MILFADRARQFGFDYYFNKPADLTCLHNIPNGSSVRAILADRLKNRIEVHVR